MKKYYSFLSVILLSFFSSCSGVTAYKVTLTGTHCHFEKDIDEAKRGYNYQIKAICDRGYSLTRDNINIKIGELDPLESAQFNEEENILFIDGSVIVDNITIEAIADYGEYTLKIVANDKFYESPISQSKDITIEDSTPDLDLEVIAKEGYDVPTDKSQISVTDEIEYSYTLNEGIYHLTISHTQFYKNIVVSFPDLG